MGAESAPPPLITHSSSLITSLRRAVLDLLFPPRCAGCGLRGTWLCAACLATLPRPRPPLCARCGTPIAGEGCFACVRPGWALTALRVASAFTPPVSPLVHRLKFRGGRHLAEPLSRLLAEAYDALGTSGVPVVPVPLHPERERARGYNQAALLAQGLAKQRGMPCLPLLIRVRATPPQVGLSAVERWQNVAGAFAATSRLNGARLVLVDDVATTGATLNAAAVALKDAGARWVGGIALARPGLGGGSPAASA